MIERFSIGVSAKQLAVRYDVEEPLSFQSRYNVAPSQLVPLITQGTVRGFSFFYWGQLPGWTKNKTLAEKIINVRAEQITERPATKKNLKMNRCLIPADGFYSWKKMGKKSLIPWRFSLKDKGIFSMAGLWEEYDDEEGNNFHTFTILTVPSNEFVLPVNERMPAILFRDQEETWLKKDADETDLLTLCKSAPAALFDGFAVSPQLNTISFDRPSLLLPVPPTDQFGNLTLFD
ncbi:MAG TPA: SOS response-associated peptidase [Cyclobacteriaceae bacterium]|nr:SOS response-associated peptidase [Cyclobacteriaceae bacterium]